MIVAIFQFLKIHFNEFLITYEKKVTNVTPKLVITFHYYEHTSIVHTIGCLIEILEFDTLQSAQKTPTTTHYHHTSSLLLF